MNTFSFSLSKLISSLINQPNRREYISLPDEEIKPTTIRLDPAVRKFCDDQAEKMGISVQAFIAMVLNGVMLESTNPAKSELQLMYERFFEIFKMHNITIADIPTVLNKFNIPLSTLADPHKLLDMMDENLISYLSEQFYANPVWLKGASNEARGRNLKWYKNTSYFCSHLINLQKNGLAPHLMLVQSNKTNLKIKDNSINTENHIIPIIRLSKNYLPGKNFNCYQVCKSEPWSYWRSRYQLKSIILFCNLSRISFGGYTVNFSEFTDLNQRHQLVNETNFGSYTWYPEDYVNHYEGDYPTQKCEEELLAVYNEFFENYLDKHFTSEDHQKLVHLEKIRKKHNDLLSKKPSA